MATEEGIVIAANAHTARIKTTRSSACETCSAKQSCHTHGGGEEHVEVDVINTIGARVEDRVVIYFGTASLLKASFLLYFFPVIIMMGGAILGHRLALARSWDPSLGAATLGFFGLACALLIVRIVGRRLATQKDYKPKIIRILGNRPKW